MPNEKQAGPDMSVFLSGWMADNAISSSGTEARLNCPADRPLILEMEVNNASLPEKGHICLLRATTREEELWAVRVNSAGSLMLQPGTRPASSLSLPAPVHDATGRFKLSVSFDPILGGIVLATDFTNRVLGDKCRNAWVDFYDRMGRPPEDTYRVTVGCPLDGRADLPPLGWTISAKYRFGPKYAQGAAGAIQELADKHLMPKGLAAEIREELEQGTADVLRQIAADKAYPGEREQPFFRGLMDALLGTGYEVGETAPYTAADAALHRLYTKAAEGADHTELSAEWHLGVVAGVRSQGWKGGKP